METAEWSELQTPFIWCEPDTALPLCRWQDYPDDEILLVYDRAFTYGQLFYLVLTPEAKDRILNVRRRGYVGYSNKVHICSSICFVFYLTYFSACVWNGSKYAIKICI